MMKAILEQSPTHEPLTGVRLNGATVKPSLTKPPTSGVGENPWRTETRAIVTVPRVPSAPPAKPRATPIEPEIGHPESGEATPVEEAELVLAGKGYRFGHGDNMVTAADASRCIVEAARAGEMRQVELHYGRLETAVITDMAHFAIRPQISYELDRQGVPFGVYIVPVQMRGRGPHRWSTRDFNYETFRIDNWDQPIPFHALRALNIVKSMRIPFDSFWVARNDAVVRAVELEPVSSTFVSVSRRDPDLIGRISGRSVALGVGFARWA